MRITLNYDCQPKNYPRQKAQYTPVLIVLYLSNLTSASSPKRNSIKNRKYPISKNRMTFFTIHMAVDIGGCCKVSS